VTQDTNMCDSQTLIIVICEVADSFGETLTTTYCGLRWMFRLN